MRAIGGMRGARIVLAVTGSFLAVAGGVFLFFAGATSAAVGIRLTSDAAFADYRSVYAGLHLGLGGFLVVSAFSPAALSRGLLAATHGLLGLTVGRISSVALQGSIDALTFWLLIPELFGALICGLYYRLTTARTE